MLLALILTFAIQPLADALLQILVKDNHGPQACQSFGLMLHLLPRFFVLLFLSPTLSPNPSPKYTSEGSMSMVRRY